MEAVTAVVRCFAALAKSNGILMGDALSTEDRQNVVSLVQEYHKRYQQLLSASSMAFDANPRSRSRMSGTVSLDGDKAPTGLRELSESGHDGTFDQGHDGHYDEFLLRFNDEHLLQVRA